MRHVSLGRLALAAAMLGSMSDVVAASDAPSPRPVDALPPPFRDSERIRAAEAKRARRAAKCRKVVAP